MSTVVTTELLSMVISSIETVQSGIENSFKKMKQDSQPTDYLINSHSHLDLSRCYECVDILVHCSLHLLRKEFIPTLYRKVLPFFSYPIPCKLVALYEYCHVELPRCITSDQINSVMVY